MHVMWLDLTFGIIQSNLENIDGDIRGVAE